MSWDYASLTEFEPHIAAYRAEIRARRKRGPAGGEVQQTAEVEKADLVEILEAARKLVFEYRDPYDVESLKRLRVDGKLCDDYFYLSESANSCRIVYFRDVLKHSAIPYFIYNVNHSRVVPARGMLTLVSRDDER